jgi:hypothetical protein
MLPDPVASIMQAPPVVVHPALFPFTPLGAPGLDFEIWETAINGLASSRTGIIAFQPASGSSTGVTVE